MVFPGLFPGSVDQVCRKISFKIMQTGVVENLLHKKKRSVTGLQLYLDKDRWDFGCVFAKSLTKFKTVNYIHRRWGVEYVLVWCGLLAPSFLFFWRQRSIYSIYICLPMICELQFGFCLRSTFRFCYKYWVMRKLWFCWCVYITWVTYVLF